MANLIGLLSEISTSVKLAWVVVLAWGAVQFVWYQRAHALPEATESWSNSWSAGRFPSVTRPPEALDAPRPRISRPVSDAVDVDVDVEIASVSAEAADAQEGVSPRKRSNRRQRSASSSDPGDSVPDFALETPKAT